MKTFSQYLSEALSDADVNALIRKHSGKTVFSIGQIAHDGSVVSHEYPHHNSLGHAMIFPGRLAPPAQRFRLENGRLWWDDVPTQDDAFAVEDYYARLGITGLTHVPTPLREALLHEAYSLLEFKDRLRKAPYDNQSYSYFLLPDGSTWYTDGMHFNVTTPEELKALKVVRMGTADLYEVHAPITAAQATAMVDLHIAGGQYYTLHIDCNDGRDTFANRGFDRPNADGIRRWIAAQFAK